MKTISYLLLMISLYGCYAQDPVTTGKEGKLLPAFDMLMSDSITHLNSGNIPNNNATVFFYFGPHCPYSHAQMEEIIEDMDRFKDVHFYLLTNATYGEMKGFYDLFKLGKYQNISVGLDDTKVFLNYFEITGVPYIAVYGKDKKLRKAFEGKVYIKQIVQALED